MNSSVQHNGWNQEHLIENSWRTLGLDIYCYNSVDMLTVTDLLSRSIFVQVLAKSKKGYTSSDVAKALFVKYLSCIDDITSLTLTVLCVFQIPYTSMFVSQ
jgi:hypothetical protein